VHDRTTARPSARTVLLKGLDERGVVFFTNYTSNKSHDLMATRYASAELVALWSPEEKVRMERRLWLAVLIVAIVTLAIGGVGSSAVPVITLMESTGWPF